MPPPLKDPTPLHPSYLPHHTVDREDEREALNPVFATFPDPDPVNVFIHGPRGTGKTHLTHLLLDDLPDDTTTCYIPCTRYDTQYKVLKQLCHQITDELIGDGSHTAQLQRKLDQHCTRQQTVVVLDDIEFLFLNDADSLLYSLTRMEHSEHIGIITISANHANIHEPLEERTYSSLYPQRIGFEPYTAEQIYRILVERARNSLAEQSLRQEALSYIASTTQNVSTALFWLKTAAETASDVITDTTVKDARDQAFQNHVDHLLDDFTEHHRLLYQGIQELTTEQDTPSIRTGDIYDRYQDLCRTYSEESLSQRRIGTYLKHLELLDIVKADYHYGGSKGKTREIAIQRMTG